MPIVGLTNREPSFKEGGRLRLGIPKSEAMKSGPREISYFRFDPRPETLEPEEELVTMHGARPAAIEDEFVAVYGAQPTALTIRIPFAQIERCWDAFYTVYNKSGMLGMADGKKWLYLRHNQTGELLVKGGMPMRPTPNMPVDENGMVYMPFDESVPVYSYVNKKGDDVPVYARPEGKLKVFLPALNRAVYFVVVTHSKYNIIRISEQLAGIAGMAKNLGTTISMVPILLTRRKELISCSINGQKSMQEKYLLNLEIHPDWMKEGFGVLDRILPGASALPALPPPATASAPIILPKNLSPKDFDESDDYPEEADQPPAPAPEPAPTPEPPAQKNALAESLLPGEARAAARAALINSGKVMKAIKAIEYPFEGAERLDLVKAAANALYAHIKAYWGAQAAVSTKGVLADCIGSNCGWDWREIIEETERRYGETATKDTQVATE